MRYKWYGVIGPGLGESPADIPIFLSVSLIYLINKF
jgi:hypothetical protein